MLPHTLLRESNYERKWREEFVSCKLAVDLSLKLSSSRLEQWIFDIDSSNKCEELIRIPKLVQRTPGSERLEEIIANLNQ